MAKAIQNLAAYWRSVPPHIDSWGDPPPGMDRDAYYYEKADALFRSCTTSTTTRIIPLPPDEHFRIASECGVLPIAVILLTYGRLDVLPYILFDTLDIPMSTVKRSAWTLIPFPEEIRQRGNRAAVAWVEQNKDRLHLDKEKGVFVLTEPVEN